MFFYKNAIKSFREIKAYYLPGSIQDIRRDCIYENHLLLNDDGNPFKSPSRFPPYAPEYICDLPVTNHPREFRSVYRELIPKLNKSFMIIGFSKNNKNEFFVTVEDKDLDLSKISFKELYKILLNKKPKISNLWVGKWTEDTGVEEDKWPGIWENVHSSSLNQKIQSSIWETLHRNFMCAYFAKIIYNKSAVCLLCKNEQITRTHIFMNCEVILECYRRFQTTTDSILNLGTVGLIERAFGVKIGDFERKNCILRNYVNFCIRHIVYRSRNKVFGSSLLTTVTNVCNKIETFIHNDLQQKIDLAKFNNTLNRFEEDFLHANVLGKIENGELVLNNLVNVP